MKTTLDDRTLVRQVRLLVFDFDGVFTDNMVWVHEDGSEMVRCWRGDGLGLSRLRSLGVELLVLSTEANRVVSARCRKLKLECIQNVQDKGERLAELSKARGIPLHQIAYVGNDINDAACLQAVGLPIVVADAHPDVLSLARLRATVAGGRGAVREICDLFHHILQNRE